LFRDAWDAWSSPRFFVAGVANDLLFTGNNGPLGVLPLAGHGIYDGTIIRFDKVPARSESSASPVRPRRGHFIWTLKRSRLDIAEYLQSGFHRCQGPLPISPTSGEAARLHSVQNKGGMKWKAP
jgi:hypothetical protein